ncbi:hypothetical protein V2J09_004423 [Rumex salicifolius]
MYYVDDLIVTGSEPNLVQKFIGDINHVFALKDLGGLKFFLGIQIDQTALGITLSQEGYITDLFGRFNMQDAKPISTPADPSYKLQLQGELFSYSKLYRQIIGSLNMQKSLVPTSSMPSIRSINICILRQLCIGRFCGILRALIITISAFAQPNSCILKCRMDLGFE